MREKKIKIIDNPHRSVKKRSMVLYISIVSLNTLPYNYLYRKPSITDTFNEEESIVGVCAVFVQGPGSDVVPCFDCDIPDDGNSHVGVGLQTEGQDGGQMKNTEITPIT